MRFYGNPRSISLTPQPLRDPTSTMSFVDASILSRLDLPTFDGNLLEYPEFFSRYSSLIGNKTELNDTTKFSLLKSCLRGKALQSVQGLALTAVNYHIALDILKNRYDDKVTTRHILFSQLANLPPCDPEGKDLQSLYNKMFALTRQLCAYEDDAKETALGVILINKLPRRIRSQIYDKTGNSHNLTPMELMHILTEIVHKEATLQEIDFHCRIVTSLREEGYNLCNGYQLVHSSIGDIITGKPLRPMKSIDYWYSSSSSDDERQDDLLQRFWTLDTQGTLDNVVSTDDEICLKNFNETIHYDNAEGRYVVQLPFKGDKKDLPSNIQLAYARLVKNIKLLRHRNTTESSRIKPHVRS
ncbi:unnamed protein product [Heligmosomoides polygyrus]|uniref:MIR domain-containing protein n=1 Tax=Heligmosomoides polygyrus TaxID=6339 RepID=A0A183GN08_HELPZ|nr:unnamed protein product [Heligmosomoides polygyrus]